jgi:hypothetical protein
MRINNDWRQSEDEQKITTRDKEFWGFTETYFRTQHQTHIAIQASICYSGFDLPAHLVASKRCHVVISTDSDQGDVVFI